MRMQITEIMFEQVEGRDIQRKTFTNWAEVEQHINRIAIFAPNDGSYFKSDFLLAWEDGHTYKGRFDLKREHTQGENLSKHVQDLLLFYSGEKEPHWLSKEEYRQAIKGKEEQAKYQLDNYEIG